MDRPAVISRPTFLDNRSLLLLAFGLCIGLFLYFLLLGSCIVRALHASRSLAQDLLIAPPVGMGAALIPVFLLNHNGIPVLSFGRWLLPILPVLALIGHLLMNRRAKVSLLAPPQMPWWRTYAPFFALILLGLCLTGRPMFKYGFDWLSFCNDDMANYTLAADRFLYHGFLDPPTAASLIRGDDYSQAYWFFHVPSMVRAGAELMIAWTCSFTGLSAHEVFMPLIVSFHLCLISAAGGLVYTSEERRAPALMAAFLVAASAELTFGTVYQLIAQSSGLGVLAVNVAILCRPFDGLTRRQLVRQGALVAIVLTTQLLIYPEVNPFLAIAFVIFIGIGLFRKRLKFKPVLAVLTVGGILTLLLLNTYVYDALAFMLSQRGQATQMDDPAKTLFPFFLLPSGLANYWGITRIAYLPGEPLNSLVIAAAVCLMVIAVISVIWLAWRGEPAACMGMVCILLAIPLFIGNIGFGLYKLAMFAQPFILGSVVIAWWTLVRRRRWAAPLVLLLAVPSLRVQGEYVQFSQGTGATFVEIVGATTHRILRDIMRVAKTESPDGPQTPIIFDTYNITLSKILALYTRGRSAAFPSSRLTQLTLMPRGTPDLAKESYRVTAQSILDVTWRNIHNTPFEYEPRLAFIRSYFEQGWMSMFLPLMPDSGHDEFYIYNQGGRPTEAQDTADTLLVVTRGNLNLLNSRRFAKAEPLKDPFVVTTVGAVHNFLLFRESHMSQPYYSTDDPKFISLYQIEEDPMFYKGQPMAGVGRHFLFEVLRPDPKVRFVMELSCSLKGDGKNLLPADAGVIGDSRVAMPFVGRGSGRVFSEPFKPQIIHGRPHAAIDLGEWGEQFEMLRTGAMKMFGSRVQLDRRLLVGFGRDISMISDTEYQNLRPPPGVTLWTSNDSELRNPDLEYSGVYEDGWVAEKSFLTLGQPANRTRLTIRGAVPFVKDATFTSALTLSVDDKPVAFTATQGGKPVVNGKFAVGAFDLSADVPATDSFRRRIDMNWSQVQLLGGVDRRPVAVQLSYISLDASEKAK